jgi:hypothetical protein
VLQSAIISQRLSQGHGDIGRCVMDLNAMLIVGAAASIKLPAVSVGLLAVPNTECPATTAKQVRVCFGQTQPTWPQPLRFRPVAQS